MKQPKSDSHSNKKRNPKRKLTIFSWGYWGWGNSARHFVKAADAVEASRGYNQLIFVDVRLRRAARAVCFRGPAFGKIVGDDRYCWINGLGNSEIADHTLKRMTIKNPKEAESLLDLAIEYEKENRRVLYFCACKIPKWCHRYKVGALLLNAAKRRGINLEVVEWPGGEPQTLLETASEDVFKKLQGDSVTFPLPSRLDLAKYGGLPWGSIVKVKSPSQSLLFSSGPAAYVRDKWVLKLSWIASVDYEIQLKKTAVKCRREDGYEPRTSVM